MREWRIKGTKPYEGTDIRGDGAETGTGDAVRRGDRLRAETVFNSIGQRIRHTPEYTMEVYYNEKNNLDQVLRYCKDSRMTIVNLKIHILD